MAGDADNAELHSQTLAAAVALQHAALPRTLPTPPGWETGHHYRPSGRTEVGGDFYDVIDFEDGRVVMFVGDVMGRGVGAAAAMAQMRAAIRAYAAVDPSPEVVLTKLDRMFARYKSEQLVTLSYLLADPARDDLLVGNAGHLPPLLLHRDGTCTQLPFADGPPLGVPAPARQRVGRDREGFVAVRGTLTTNTPQAEQAAQAIAEAAESLEVDLAPIVPVAFAVAALASFDRHVVVDEGVSAGVWKNEESAAAIRRRLRDEAAVRALDEGYTLTAEPMEKVTGLGPSGETLPLQEADTVIVQHSYPARFLLPAGVVGH